MPEPHPLDDPARRRRAVKALLVLSPAMFIFIYWLAWVQGGRPQDRLLLAGIMTVACLGTALVIHSMGSRSRWALILVRIALALAKRR